MNNNFEIQKTPFFGKSQPSFSNSCDKFSSYRTIEDKMDILPQNPIFTPSKEPMRYAAKYPENRLFSESKTKKFIDMKKNMCDRMMDRIINHRRERMDSILYSKSLIIENCKNDVYDVKFLVKFILENGIFK